MTETLIALRGVTFAYDETPVLEDLSVSIDAGECVALVGPNGAGKTTLLSLMLGLLEPDAGTVSLCGEDVTRLSRRAIARNAALVPQDTAMHFSFTVRDIVAMGRTPYLGRFRPETAADLAVIDAALESTETAEFADRSISELSGGERQRVILARAFAQEAPVLLLDEPTANLDLVHQLETLDLIRRHVDDGHCAVAALHDLSLAARYCSRIIVLANHTIVDDGAPAAVITKGMLERYFMVDADVHTDDAGVTIIPRASTRSARR